MMSTANSNEGGSEFQGRSEKITGPAQIVGLLKRIKDNRSLLTVTIPGGNGIYSSSILDVLPEQKQLLLDELVPVEGHRRLISVGRLHAYTRLNGVEVHFSAELQEPGSENGIAFYRLALPQAVDYRQRREFYRVRVGLALDMPIKIAREENAFLEGRVIDLSAGGIGVHLKENVKLSVGQVLACTLRLPQGQRIAADIELRSVKWDEGTQRLRVGARFLHLSAAERTAIQRLVMTLDREMIRKLPRN